MSPAARETMPFTASAAKFTIGSLDNPKITISAQYNPAEVQVTQAIGWAQHQKQANDDDQALHYEFGARSSREYTVELVFDGVESQGNLGKNSPLTVEGEIAKLQTLVDVLQEDRPKDGDYRPHFCVAVWGKGGLPAMSCIIKNLQTKYQRFDSMGRVLRATVTIAIAEAYRVDKDKKTKHVTSETWRSAVSNFQKEQYKFAETRKGFYDDRTWSTPAALDQNRQNRYRKDAQDRPIIDEGVEPDNSDR